MRWAAARFCCPRSPSCNSSAGRRPLALIDVGCSAGLHLLWDRYSLRLRRRAGRAIRARPCRITCELRGPDHAADAGAVFPACAFRVGIDLNPVDLRDPIERRWFEALIWPEHDGRRRLAAAAIDELLRDPPSIVKGDAVEVLEPELERVPSDATLVVYNSAALCQGGLADETAIATVLDGVFVPAARFTGCTAKDEEVLSACNRPRPR